MEIPSKTDEEWTMVITPRFKWWDVNWRELWHYRDLIFLFVRRDFVAYYKQTILGPIWFFLQPALNTLVFTIIFGKIAQIPTNNISRPLFYLSGLTLWNYFAACLTGTSNTFLGNAHIMGKVYFPRLCIPAGIVISNILQFGIQFSLFLIIYLYYALAGVSLHPNWFVLGLPVILLQMALLGLGCGILVSSLTTRYRDLALAVTFGVQLWFYLTPVVYPTTQIPENFRNLFFLNPMVGVIEAFRYAFFSDGSFHWSHLLVSWIITAGVFTLGILMFHRVEKSFMDTI